MRVVAAQEDVDRSFTDTPKAFREPYKAFQIPPKALRTTARPASCKVTDPLIPYYLPKSALATSQTTPYGVSMVQVRPGKSNFALI